MPVTIILEDDEALVLFDALTSGRLMSDDPPERNSLWALESLLERALVAPLGSTYAKLVDAARASVVERGGN
jgi:hypothetical protein